MITSVIPEIRAALKSKKFGRVFQTSRWEFIFDLRIGDSLYLFISIEPAAPRMYLVKRRLRDIERNALSPSPFLLFLKKRISNAEITDVFQLESERVVMLELRAMNELGQESRFSLVIQLTGRSSNLFLCDEKKFVLAAVFGTETEGQQPGDRYTPPPMRKASATPPGKKGGLPEYLKKAASSEALDRFYIELAEKRRFDSLAASARAKIASEAARRKRLIENLNSDIERHGDAQKWKLFGDLLLANAANAVREGDKFIVVNYYDPEQKQISIEADIGDSVTEAAEKYFKKFVKAKNAAAEIATRLSQANTELEKLEQKKAVIEKAIAEENIDLLQEFIGSAGSAKKKAPAKAREAKNGSDTFARRFLSTDGFEILVGKKAKDNDQLTFRYAKSLDTWLHAADYPGSHVVIRNPDRREIPPRTLLEAAQLAAFYSQGNKQPKAAVHYTLKKFVSKPRGSSPGLVSLASFKTILVEPKVSGTRQQQTTP